MDKVKVISNGGISALSAFFTGFGSSVALDLPIELTISRSDSTPASNQGTISETLDLLKKRFDVQDCFKVTVSKAIPRGKGLKSSSALTLSLTLGFLKLNGISMGEKQLLDLSAELSIGNGTSSTGAYDDLCSSYYGGACFTNNTERNLIFREKVDGKPVIVAFNKARRASSSVDLSDMKRFSRHAEIIQDLIKERKFYEAMTLNGNLLGYIYGQNSDLIRYLLSSGALYSAQCGKGPAVFGIFDNEEEFISAGKGLTKFFGVKYRKSLFSGRESMVTEL